MLIGYQLLVAFVGVRVVDGEWFVDGSTFRHELDGAARVGGDIADGHQTVGQGRTAGDLENAFWARN